MIGIASMICAIRCVLTTRDVGLLAIRVAIGGALVAHGAQKLFGWFGGAGLKRTGAPFERLRVRPRPANPLAAGLGERDGGAEPVPWVGRPQPRSRWLVSRLRASR